MDASLDTNVIIHLYNADFQDLLFNRFEKLKVYEFIRTQEYTFVNTLLGFIAPVRTPFLTMGTAILVKLTQIIYWGNGSIRVARGKVYG